MGQERVLSKFQIQNSLYYIVMCILSTLFCILLGGLLWLVITSPVPIKGHLVIIIMLSLLLIISLLQIIFNGILWNISRVYYKFHEDFMLTKTALQKKIIATSYSRWEKTNKYWIKKAHKSNY